jgi:hypothetical protein
MMVDHDDFDTQPAGQTNRRLRIDPVVDRQEQVCAAQGKLMDRGCAEPIAVVPMRQQTRTFAQKRRSPVCRM